MIFCDLEFVYAAQDMEPDTIDVIQKKNKNFLKTSSANLVGSTDGKN